MSDLLWQGLIISIMGMTLTFVALGLLILAMTLLVRFSPNEAQLPLLAETEPDKNLAVSIPTQDSEAEISAAIAVALLYLRSTDGDLGATLETGRGAWWVAGRARQQTGRTRQQAAPVSKTTRWRK